MRDRQAGFTLIELLVTIAVISILAVIALPSFFSESRKTRAFSEVQPIFNDLRVRIEQAMQENGLYPLSIGEATMWPATGPSTTRQPIDPLPLTWQTIKVRISGESFVYCSYTWVSDNIGTLGVSGPVEAQGAAFGFVAPPTNWYYLLAKCDMDGDGITFSWYFSSSTNPSILKMNEGS